VIHPGVMHWTAGRPMPRRPFVAWRRPQSRLASAAKEQHEERKRMSVHDFKVKAPGGTEQPLSDYKGRPMLIVNTASKCGFTPQYAGLEKLHRELGPKGLAVIGFPCNQFGAQEPGDEEEIRNFCSLSYDVTFPVMAKVDVNGDNADPLFKHLKAEKKGLLGTAGIKWNFTKFLVDKDGKVVGRYGPTEKPETLVKDIEKLL
jgi:glutathione peroxidase